MIIKDFEKLRQEMVQLQIVSRGIRNERVLEAFRNVPRHCFVPENIRGLSYQDRPLPIGEGQTISQPYIVALMTELLDVKPDTKVLEVGTGSGYQAAILSYLGADVYTVEVKTSLANQAKCILDSLGYKINLRIGDGSLGWEDYCPYDAIVVTAASPRISPCWQQQLKIGGKMVIPLGTSFQQDLTVVEKVSEDKFKRRVICGCIFVPLVGRYGHKESIH
jgi:protein-L-isoaspartate(D-aspartate) O-methyltransferase